MIATCVWVIELLQRSIYVSLTVSMCDKYFQTHFSGLWPATSTLEPRMSRMLCFSKEKSWTHAFSIISIARLKCETVRFIFFVRFCKCEQKISLTFVFSVYIRARVRRGVRLHDIWHLFSIFSKKSKKNPSDSIRNNYRFRIVYEWATKIAVKQSTAKTIWKLKVFLFKQKQ